MKTKVGIIFGGCSSEYDVSLVSVTSVIKNINKEKYDVVLIGITKQGDFYLYQGDIEKIEKNIDFRRVRNLKIYFDNNAISLTTDIKDFKEWQGGDIIVFKNHIGIISDKRNKNGIPFIIHHASPVQRAYEEDILEVKTDIIGHYRY